MPDASPSIASATPAPAATPAAATPAPAAAPAAAPSSAPAAPAAAPSSDKPSGAAAASPDKPAAAKPGALTDAPEAPKLGADGKPIEAAKDDAPKPNVPEKYEFKLPDGIKLDEARSAQFTDFAKGKGWDQETAQSALDMHLAEMKNQTEGIYNQWHDMQRTWQAQIMSDKDLGGNNFTQTTKHLASAIDAFGPEIAGPFREALNFTGAGNNPAVVRYLAKLGARFSEGGPVNGRPGGATDAKGVAAKMYPSHTSPKG